MHGLKINISLTFIVLLATGMLLTNAIMTTLWQHSIINTVIENNAATLETIAKNTVSDTRTAKIFFATAREKTPGLCGAILLGGSWQTIPASPCGQFPELRKVTEQALTTEKLITSSTGSTLGIFFSQKKYLHIAVPLPGGHTPSGAIGLAYPLQPIWQALRQNQKIILVYILVNTLILSVIGFFRLASIVIRPIERLVQETSNYNSEQNLAFVSESEGSEYRQLSAAINSMVQRIDQDKINLQKTVHSLQQANETIQATQQEMVRTEKLASVGRLSAGLAHEIGNPLGIVLGYLGLLRHDKISPEEKLEYIQRSEQELNRINLLVRQLLDFSRPLPATSEPVHVHTLLLELLQMLQAQNKNKDISFETSLQGELDVVHGNKEALHQAFINFFLNALDALHETNHPKQGTIRIESKNIVDKSGKNMLQVIITDNGAGISPAHLENIFDPFYTTKDPGKGTGLGLSVSHTIIDNTGGTVHARSTEGQGTSIIVVLPTLNKVDSQ